MAEIIRGDQVVVDGWQVLRPSEDTPLAGLPAGPVLVPLAVWLARHAELIARGDVAVWLAGTDDPAQLAPWLTQLPLVAVDFPRFTDGRGYSIAVLLRSRFGYRGELRAIGDVLPDQLFYLRRVGFDAFALRADKDIRKALQVLRPFTDSYQGSSDNPVPAFRRRTRDWPASRSGN